MVQQAGHTNNSQASVSPGSHFFMAKSESFKPQFEISIAPGRCLGPLASLSTFSGDQSEPASKRG